MHCGRVALQPPLLLFGDTLFCGSCCTGGARMFQSIAPLPSHWPKPAPGGTGIIRGTPASAAAPGAACSARPGTEYPGVEYPGVEYDGAPCAGAECDGPDGFGIPCPGTDCAGAECEGAEYAGAENAGPEWIPGVPLLCADPGELTPGCAAPAAPADPA